MDREDDWTKREIPTSGVMQQGPVPKASRPPREKQIVLSVTVLDVLGLLNEAVDLDHEAVRALCEGRVPCNEDLARHPTIQVSSYQSEESAAKSAYRVGLIGILNGLFGIDPESGWGAIAANYDVVCPSGETELCAKIPDRLRVGDQCPGCRKGLVLGRLRGFELTKQAMAAVREKAKGSEG
ncbi:MAG: hypothetical protein ABFD77_07355 [Thermotogota bacterium]